MSVADTQDIGDMFQISQTSVSRENNFSSDRFDFFNSLDAVNSTQGFVYDRTPKNFPGKNTLYSFRSSDLTRC